MHLLFTEYKARLEMLKIAIPVLAIENMLSCLSKIKATLLNDSEVSNICTEDANAANERREILDEIRNLEITTINNVINSGDIQNRSYCQFNYSSAKCELIRIINTELQSKDNRDLEVFAAYYALLQHILTKCQTDKYKIALIAPYQSGKTTTFNALIGGRNLGAMGDGTRTSAVPLSVSYSEKETVKLTWNTKEEILRLFTYLNGYARSETLVKFDIDNIESRNALQNELEELRKDPQAKKYIKPKAEQFLIICSFILAHWDSEELKVFKTKEISLSDLPTITRFPKQMGKRWRKGGHTAFTFKEVLFAFLKTVDCTCNSEALKKLNGTIIDCPGLFYASYDTHITEQAMRDADAIWFIYPRATEAGEENNDFLDKFKSNYSDYSNKIFATNNLSFEIAAKKTTKAVYKKNFDDLKNLFGDDKELYPYDAYLAYLGNLKSLYDSNELDEEIIKGFIKSDDEEIDDLNHDSGDDSANPLDKVLYWTQEIFKSESTATFDDVWHEKIFRYTKSYTTTADEAIKNSGITNVIEMLNKFIEANKAYSIIISQGVDKLQQELMFAKNGLIRKYIEPHTIDRDSLVALWSKRVTRAEGFKKTADAIVHATLFNPSDSKEPLVNRLADSVYSKLFNTDVYDAMAENICTQIYANIDKIKKIRKNEPELKKCMEEIVTKCISEKIADRVEHWNNLLSSNQDKDFSNIFILDITEMEKDLLSQWNNTFVDDNKFIMSDCFKISKDLRTMKIESEEQHSSVDLEKKRINTVIALNYASIATLVASISGACVLYLVACVASGPIGWLIAGLTTLIVGIWTGMNIDEYNEKNFRKKILPDLKKQLENRGIRDSIRKMIYDEIEKMLGIYEKQTTVDMKWIECERDVATSTTTEKKETIERSCYKAAGIVDLINKINKIYNKFKLDLNIHV